MRGDYDYNGDWLPDPEGGCFRVDDVREAIEARIAEEQTPHSPQDDGTKRAVYALRTVLSGLLGEEDSEGTTIKIVVGNHYGMNDLTDAQKAALAEKLGRSDIPEGTAELDRTGRGRTDPDLIAAIEEHPEGSRLTVVEIPAGVQWQIEDHDGAEWVAEKHRTWRPESD